MTTTSSNIITTTDTLTSNIDIGEYNTIWQVLPNPVDLTFTDTGDITLHNQNSVYTLAPGTNTVHMNDTNVSGSDVVSNVGNATIIVFDGTASQYTVIAEDNVFGITVNGTNGSSNFLTQATELQFSDVTEVVASQTAQPGTQVSSATIVGLLGAALGGVPSATDLAHYEGLVVGAPQTSALTVAETILLSSEYTSNPAHNYAQSPAGDDQFITDTYANLLHRAPEAGAVDYYYNNVIAPVVKGLTPGTTAYAQAELQAHAQVLVYFSQSPEFLSDVSITAANPASATHWLQLV